MKKWVVGPAWYWRDLVLGGSDSICPSKNELQTLSHSRKI